MSKHVLSLIPFTLLTACASEPQPEPRMTPAAGVLAEMTWGTRVSIAEFAAVECGREVRCGNVGDDRSFLSETQCRNSWTFEGYGLFGPVVCRNGVDGVRFRACLDAIEAAPCETADYGVLRVASCQPEDVCLRE